MRDLRNQLGDCQVPGAHGEVDLRVRPDLAGVMNRVEDHQQIADALEPHQQHATNGAPAGAAVGEARRPAQAPDRQGPPASLARIVDLETSSRVRVLYCDIFTKPPGECRTRPDPLTHRTSIRSIITPRSRSSGRLRIWRGLHTVDTSRSWIGSSMRPAASTAAAGSGGNTSGIPAPRSTRSTRRRRTPRPAPAARISPAAVVHDELNRPLAAREAGDGDERLRPRPAHRAAFALLLGVKPHDVQIVPVAEVEREARCSDGPVSS